MPSSNAVSAFFSWIVEISSAEILMPSDSTENGGLKFIRPDNTLISLSRLLSRALHVSRG
jgi:hypothetical protein